MSVGRHAGLNLVGTLLPMALALITVPLYLKLVGPERYGILAIAWLFLGYFGVFDLGLSRAAAQKIAAASDRAPEYRAGLFGTAMVTSFVMGCLGALFLWPAAHFAFAGTIEMPAHIRAEAVQAAPLMAITLPFAVIIATQAGALQGRQRFFEMNRSSVTSTALFQILPLLAAWWFGPSLVTLLIASLIARVIGVGVFWQNCAREFGASALARFDRSELRGMIGFGGWVMVTSLFAPLIMLCRPVPDRLAARRVRHRGLYRAVPDHLSAQPHRRIHRRRAVPTAGAGIGRRSKPPFRRCHDCVDRAVDRAGGRRAVPDGAGAAPVGGRRDRAAGRPDWPGFIGGDVAQFFRADRQYPADRRWPPGSDRQDRACGADTLSDCDVCGDFLVRSERRGMGFCDLHVLIDFMLMQIIGARRFFYVGHMTLGLTLFVASVTVSRMTDYGVIVDLLIASGFGMIGVLGSWFLSTCRRSEP